MQKLETCDSTGHDCGLEKERPPVRSSGTIEEMWGCFASLLICLPLSVAEVPLTTAYCFLTRVPSAGSSDMADFS